MRDGGPIEIPEANITAPEFNQTPHQKYSRELSGITDRRHFQCNPLHDLGFSYGIVTASGSASAAPSSAWKAVEPATDMSTDRGSVPEASSDDEEPGSGRKPRPRNLKDTLDDGVRANEKEIATERRGRCTRSRLGRTAPPERPDTKDLCQECKIRAQTTGTRDCARYVYVCPLRLGPS